MVDSPIVERKVSKVRIVRDGLTQIGVEVVALGHLANYVVDRALMLGRTTELASHVKSSRRSYNVALQEVKVPPMNILG